MHPRLLLSQCFWLFVELMGYIWLCVTVPVAPHLLPTENRHRLVSGTGRDDPIWHDIPGAKTC